MTSQTDGIETMSSVAFGNSNVLAMHVGNAPSSIGVSPGEHTIKVTKASFRPWERKMKTSTGNVKITAELEPVAEGKQ